MRTLALTLLVLVALGCVLFIGLHPETGILYDQPGIAASCLLIGLGLCRWIYHQPARSH